MSIVLPTPDITFEYWTATLQIDYSSQEVPLPMGESDWKIWAQNLVQRNVFQNDSIPNPVSFDTWRDWASRVVQVLGV